MLDAPGITLTVNAYDLSAMSDDWSELVTTAVEIANARDLNRWMMGDIAGKVERCYGEGSIKAFTAEVKKVQPAAMYQYLAVSSFYPPPVRVLYEMLNWSHFREAMRLDDYSAAIKLLEQANDADLSVEKLKAEVNERLGKPAPPKKVYDGVLTVEAGRDEETPLLRFDVGQLQIGKRYRVIMQEIEGEHYDTNAS